LWFPLARWDAPNWSPVRGGLNGSVLALQSYRNEIHAGGSFSNSDNQQNAAPGWGRYTIDGIPWISRQPVATVDRSPSFSEGRELPITLSVAPGYFPLEAV
jgi:hypothetical protein